MELSQINRMYQRGFDALAKELTAFSSDHLLWETVPGINNSAGNLILHITGGVRFFIGTTIGKTDYVRNREAEFQTKGLSKEELLSHIDAARVCLNDVTSKISEKDLDAEFAFDFAGKDNGWFYINYFYGHLQYHLGQISYLRRILDQS